MFRRPSKRQQARLRYRQLRVLADLSQADTADAASMTLERYWKIENGYVQPTESELTRLAKVYRMQRDGLVALLAEPTPVRV